MNQDYFIFPERQSGGIALTPKKTLWFTKILGTGLLAVVCFALYFLYTFSLSIPTTFPQDTYYEIKKGESLQTISRDLEAQGYITSASLFYYAGRVLALGGFVSGEYYLKQPQNMYQLLKIFSSGSYGYVPVKITVPEGYTNKQIATLCTKLLGNCSEVDFMTQTKRLEGYLFPATYIFSPNTNTEKVIEKMIETYYKRTADLRTQFADTGLSEKDILTLASIIEREAGTEEEKPVIAGILLKRLENNQLLQVDAPFLYVYGKASKDLSREDLRTDSPYNTYLYKGLPPTPIGNPGLSSIEAVVNPKESPYYFYLHGNDGKIHYAITYVEHLNNKKLYIK
jgi:UPF0755 protein